MSSSIALIVAMTQNHTIGSQGHMPWHLPADLKHFKQLTLNKPVIMGRKTFESIGKPLPGRHLIILTKNPLYLVSGCLTVNTMANALKAAETYDKEIMVAGGGTIYEQTLSIANRVYLTRIQANIEGDTHFPPLSPKIWQETQRDHHPADTHNLYPYTFFTFERMTGS